MKRKLEVGQVVYIHSKKVGDKDYIDNLSEFEITKIELGSIHLVSTTDNEITTIIGEQKRNFINHAGDRETLYETKEEFYEESKEYQEWKSSRIIKDEIYDRLNLLSYDELMGLSKMLNINIGGK